MDMIILVNIVLKSDNRSNLLLILVSINERKSKSFVVDFLSKIHNQINSKLSMAEGPTDTVSVKYSRILISGSTQQNLQQSTYHHLIFKAEVDKGVGLEPFDVNR